MNRPVTLVVLLAAMLVPLRAVHAQDGKKTDADLGQVRAKLQAAVEAGKISAEDAKAKMIAVKKAKLMAGKEDTDYSAIGKRLKAAVKAGKVSVHFPKEYGHSHVGLP